MSLEEGYICCHDASETMAQQDDIKIICFMGCQPKEIYVSSKSFVTGRPDMMLSNSILDLSNIPRLEKIRL